MKTNKLQFCICNEQYSVLHASVISLAKIIVVHNWKYNESLNFKWFNSAKWFSLQSLVWECFWWKRFAVTLYNYPNLSILYKARTNCFVVKEKVSVSKSFCKQIVKHIRGFFDGTYYKEDCNITVIVIQIHHCSSRVILSFLVMYL